MRLENVVALLPCAFFELSARSDSIRHRPSRAVPTYQAQLSGLDQNCAAILHSQAVHIRILRQQEVECSHESIPAHLFLEEPPRLSAFAGSRCLDLA